MHLDNVPFQVKSTLQEPSVGRILIAEPFCDDIHFHRAVILMIENQKNGCMGLVLNKQSGIMLHDIVNGLDHVDPIPIHIGGPVKSNHLFYIHNLGDLIPNSISLGNGLYIDGDFELILSFIRSGNLVAGRIMFFIGHTGWEWKQLQQEIRKNSWLVAENSISQTFGTDINTMWRRMIQSLDKGQQKWLYYPSLPTLN